jgi:hypothetical protein
MKLRFESKDALGNKRYLVVADKNIYLTNPGQAPLSLTFIVEDAAKLQFMLEDLRDANAKPEAYLSVLHMMTKGLRWSVL